jgi:hypothetical protein
MTTETTHEIIAILNNISKIEGHAKAFVMPYFLDELKEVVALYKELNYDAGKILSAFSFKVNQDRKAVVISYHVSGPDISSIWQNNPNHFATIEKNEMVYIILKAPDELIDIISITLRNDVESLPEVQKNNIVAVWGKNSIPAALVYNKPELMHEDLKEYPTVAEALFRGVFGLSRSEFTQVKQSQVCPVVLPVNTINLMTI